MDRPVPSRVQAALEFSVRAHRVNRRKDGRTPYVVHPIGVLRRLVSDLAVDDPELQCIALLHDVVEDTSISLAEIRRQFGRGVAKGVDDLTLPPGMHGRAVPDEVKTRRLVDDVRRMGWGSVVVKLCDRWDTLGDVAHARWSATKREGYRDQTTRILAAVVRRQGKDPPPERLARPVKTAIAGVRSALRTIR